MSRLLSVFLFVVLIFVFSLPVFAQDEVVYTCDGAENDALLAAESAERAGDNERALELARIAEDICRATNPSAFAQAFQMRVRLEQLVAGIDAAGNAEAVAVFNEADAYLHAGDYASALTAYQEAREMARALDFANLEVAAVQGIGKVYFTLGDYEQAVPAFADASRLAAQIPDLTSELRSLTNIGRSYEAQLEYDLALEQYLLVLDRARAENVLESEGEVLTAISGMLIRQGRYDEVDAYLPRALELTRQTALSTGRTDSLMHALQYMAAMYRLAGEYELAIQHYAEGLGIAQIQNDVIRQAEFLSFSADVFQLQALYDQALSQYEQAIALLEPLPLSPIQTYTLIGVLNNMSGAYAASGQPARALEVLERGLALAQQINYPELIGRAQINLGTQFAEQGRYTDALAYFAQAQIIFERLDNPVALAIIAGHNGYVYAGMGESARAIASLNEALRLAEPLGIHSDIINFLQALGGTYAYQGRYQEALEQYNAALERAQEYNILTAQDNLLSDISSIYRYIGDYDTALSYLQDALVLARQTTDRRNEGTILTNTAFILMAQEQYGDAMDHITNGLVIVESIEDRPNEVVLRRQLALLHYVEGRAGDALTELDRAIELANEIGMLREIESLYGLRGFVLENSGRGEEALADYQRSVDALEQLSTAAAVDTAFSSVFLEAANVVDSSYHRIAILHANAGDDVGAFDIIERERAVLLRTQLLSADVDFRASLDADLLLQEEALRQARDAAQAQVILLQSDLSASDDAIQQANDALRAARRAYDQHLELMQIEGGYLSRQIAFDTTELAVVQQRLPEDTTLLIYSVGEYDGLLLLVDATSIQSIKINLTRTALAEYIRQLVAQRTNPDDVLKQLHAVLFAPAAGEIQTSRLIVSAAGPMTYIPFAALQAPDDRYLVDDFVISTVPSGSLMTLLNDDSPNAAASGPAAVFAQSEAPGFLPLEYVEQEAERVANLLNGTTTLNATETSFRQRQPDADVLYIGTHVELEPFAPMYSAIHLAADDAHDGRLEVTEIYEMRFAGTNLVILSGCETGVAGTGQDFSLLTQAFLAGGAQKVLSSLWQVDDEATTQLLESFIAYRVEMNDDALALQAAMRDLRDYTTENGETPFKSPYFWAVFALHGNSA